MAFAPLDRVEESNHRGLQVRLGEAAEVGLLEVEVARKQGLGPCDVSLQRRAPLFQRQRLRIAVLDQELGRDLGQLAQHGGLH